jgi:hypothetical protein
VPLSENEQRLLEQMERALYADDPKFASALRGADPRTHARRRVLIASVGFVVGIALLMLGVISKIVPISVVGFVVMLAAAFFALSGMKSMPPGAGSVPKVGSAPGSPSRLARSGRPKQRVMDRFEERWNRRRDQNGR